MTLIFLAATLYDITDITQLSKPFIASTSLGRRGFSQNFLGEKDFQWQDVRAPLDNIGEEVSLSPTLVASIPTNTAFQIIGVSFPLGDFEGARLSVPLDWNSTHLGPDTNNAIAIIKKLAKVPTVDPRCRVMVMLHPGRTNS